MPVIEVRTPDKNEFELPPISVPAVTGGQIHELANLETTRGRQGLEYATILVSNGSSTRLVVLDNNNREFPVKASQPGEWDLPSGTKWIGLKPDVTIAANEVVVILTVRRLADG